ncbi:MAG: hypothetical protein ABW185_22695 [Sedimenticola sp.]
MAFPHNYMEAGGTTPGMGEAERRLEPKPRATQEQLPSRCLYSRTGS